MYPTKQEILEKEPKFKKETINMVKLWKAENIKNWKNKTKKEKTKALKMLIKTLEEIYKKPVKDVILSHSDAYDMKDQIIYLSKDKLSIISTLHEFAHHIHGSSEKKACIWSVWLFKICFPGLYKNLTWSDHLLVKN